MSTQTAEVKETTMHLSPAPLGNVRRIVLTGFMGAGKSTIGRELAARLGWNFLDLDHHLERRTQATIPELFERHGEPHFRRLESAALVSTLALTNTVIALGGGTPEIHTNRLLIEQAPGTMTIFLDAPFPVLFDPDGEKVVMGKYGTHLFPETWLIDKRGVIRARFDGGRDWANAAVVELLDQLREGTYCPLQEDKARDKDGKDAEQFCAPLVSG